MLPDHLIFPPHKKFDIYVKTPDSTKFWSLSKFVDTIIQAFLENSGPGLMPLIYTDSGVNKPFTYESCPSCPLSSSESFCNYADKY